ncbi:hypothetical protein Q4534_12875 [Cyclobacterium sp. 1_MG-2023]|uniref:hypothetical protein n=1 Tax=Cyclobacterium sp. 1_MG-2023 TaxID=3062681 RepID=UPI0026E4373F|nr:hypothetical protein [Cyclobacterium sp. 1_MG-2023]MDO6438311.1 hypothetical protein [Cyclobacterium sp. 1_MG-2023]
MNPRFNLLIGLLFWLFPPFIYAQNAAVLAEDQFQFLEELTASVLEASRIYPKQFISEEFGANNTGGVLIRPGGRNAYPSFWIRDYAMALETGMIPAAEQKHMLILTASTQAGNTWITKGGSMVPVGAVADHIRIDDGQPIYFPGTYSFNDQGTEKWGTLPPYGDQFLFVHMAYTYIKKVGDLSILCEKINGLSLIDRLALSFQVPPAGPKDHLVFASEKFRGVDFGFRDAIQMTGKLLFPSLLKYRAAKELAELYSLIEDPKESFRYQQLAERIKEVIPTEFNDDSGFLKASTRQSSQPDVWGTSLAVYLGVLDGESLAHASEVLAAAYEKGTISYRGNIRHVPLDHDFDETHVWEKSLAAKNTYQNGAFWGTPTGWVAFAIHFNNPHLAQKLALEYLNELKANDFRKGESFGAPYECFDKSGGTQNPVYLTSVACPLAAFRRMAGK